jgi:carboxylesterase type B
LNVNVHVPLSASKWNRKAVMVWLYGGGLLYGSNANPMYDGSDLAASEDVIVVVPNYRTNVFGFPGSPQIPTAQNNPGYVSKRVTYKVWL